MCKKRGIYGLLGTSWVLITTYLVYHMPTRNISLILPVYFDHVWYHNSNPTAHCAYPLQFFRPESRTTAAVDLVTISYLGR